MTSFLSTQGSQIVDENGDAVRITGVNWFGGETATLAPHGLWARNLEDMMDQMKSVGFDTIRLPFSNDVLRGEVEPSGIDFNLNPDLVGKSALEILDAVVDYAGEIGMQIILDNHRSEAGDGPNGGGLWYEGDLTHEQWVQDWVSLAERYAGNPTVVGADLANEPHGPATWGSGDPATDWAMAATEAGNAIHAVNPDWLIVVEGIQNHDGESYWWGGNLKGVADHPIELDQANKVVYSPHAYPGSVHQQPWFDDPAFPDNLPAKWTDTWGFIFQQDIAPVLLGEFGSKMTDPADVAWLQKMVAYLDGDFDGDGWGDLGEGQTGLSWTWWSWNPNSGDTGGILADDWSSPRADKLALLEPMIAGDGLPTGLVLEGNDSDDALVGQTGHDALMGAFGADHLRGKSGNDTLKGGEGADVLRAGAGVDSLDGGEGSDVLMGRRGWDTLIGGNGDDTLDGGRARDVLLGGAGDDILEGGIGADTLSGGGGADIFEFRHGHGRDKITDFEVGIDVIRLHGFGIGSFEELGDHISVKNGNAYLSFNGNGSMQLLGVDVSTLGAGDFLFA